MNNDNPKLKNLLDMSYAFPYDEATLDKLIDREMTIRTQFQFDIHSRGEVEKERGEYDTFKPCRYLAVEVLPDIIEGVMGLLNRVKTKQARKDKANIMKLESQPWLEFCAIALTTTINSAVRRDNKANLIITIADNCETEARWRQYATYESHLFDKILEQQHKSNSSTEHINTVLTLAMNRVADGKYNDGQKKPEVAWKGWSDAYSLWLGGTLLDIVIAQTNLFKLVNDTVTNTKADSTTRIYTTPLFDSYINEAENRIGLYGGFYLPLPIPPRDWTTSANGGFWTQYGRQKKLIKNWSRGYQEEMLSCTEQLSETVFPAVNAAQHTAWRINKKVYYVMRDLWEQGAAVAGLPKQEDEPLPVCPKCGKVPGENHECFKDPDIKSKEELRKKKKKARELGKKSDIIIEPNTNPVLREWKALAGAVHKENVRLKSLRLNMAYGLDVVRLLIDDERFYYVYQTDFRGRLYPLGQLTPQGTDWQKGLLEFADAVELGDYGAKWLAVHLANTWAKDGIDKKSYEDRVHWVLDSEQWILECAQNPMDNLNWTEAEEPFCFLAACFEWAGYKREGKKFKSRVAVALDGSCSGIQHYSAMLRDEVGAIATNVKRIPGTNGKNDIYGDVAKATVQLIAKDIADAEFGDYATLILAHDMLSRSIVKRAVMTLPYGSKFQSCSMYVSEKLIPLLIPYVADSDTRLQICRYVSKRVWDAIPLVVKAARRGMAYLQTLARLFSNQTLPITWTTPTGFIVQQSYFSMKGRRVELMTGGSLVLKDKIPVWQTGEERTRVTVQETDTREINPTRQVSGIAPNFIHSLDASHLMFSVKDATNHGIYNFALIHDSLGTHAGNTEQFSFIIRDNFRRLYAEHDPLRDITDHLLSQLDEALVAKAPEIPECGELDLDDIKGALYLFA